ncbi:hypothetical protein RRG08_015123, partial [Elysia crispata]
LSQSQKESGLCSAITRQTRRHFWQVTNTNCTDRAHFICQEQTQCKVQAACPSNLKLSPDSKDCVQINSVKDSKEAVCNKIGMRLVTFKPNDFGFIRFLRNLIQSSALSFWIKPNMTHEDRKKWFTRDVFFKRYGVHFIRDSSSEICAVIAHTLPMIFRNLPCETRAGGICARDPIKCPGDTEFHGQSESSILRLEKAACPSGWVITDNSVCIRIYPLYMTWSEARDRCIRAGADLLDFPSKDTYSWESFGERLDGTEEYWVGLQRNSKESCRYITFEDKDYWKVKAINSPEKCEAEKLVRDFICAMEASNWAKDSCPEGMFLFDDLCVEIIRDKQPWADARASCQQNGGDLLKVYDNDKRKTRFINAISSEHRQIYKWAKFWLGMRSESEGVYRWLDESPTMKPRLARRPHKPDKAPHCLVLMTSPVQPNIKTLKGFERCSKAKAYFCEYPAFGQVASDAFPCGTGWSEMESTCIKVFKHRLPWSEARTQCEKLGGNLLRTISAGKMWKFLNEQLSGEDLYWIGEATAKSGEFALQCGAIRQYLRAFKTMAVVTLSDCHNSPKEGYICERKPFVASTGS